MIITSTRNPISRYLENRNLFRREQIILPDGRTYGEAEEP